MRWLAPYVLVLAAWLAQPAAAQDQGAPAPARDRTGPEAGLPATPAYPTAPTPLLDAAPAPAAPAAAGQVSFSDIAVAVDGRGTARFARDWKPRADPVVGAALEGQPGEAMDPAWVKRQFVANGLIGRPAPLDRVVALVQQINLAFVQNGYVNSGVRLAGGSPQDGGVLHLTLVLGRLGGSGQGDPVSVLWGRGGAGGLDAAYVRQRMPAAYQAPLNARALELNFRLLAENPAIGTINADLHPGDAPGEAALALTVNPPTRADVYVTYANDRSPSIGAERAAIGGFIRDLAFAGDLFSAEGGVTGGHGDFNGSYGAPLIDPATTLLLRGGYNDAAVVDSALKALDITARDWSAEIGVTRMLVDRPLTPDGQRWKAARTISVGLRLSHRQSDTNLLGQPFSFSPGSVNGIADYTALRLTADWVERGVSSVSALSFTGSQGLEGTRGDVAGVVAPSPHFDVAVLQFSHAERLTPDGLELRARLSGQIASGPLYSDERISAGGADTVRGYRETLLLADTGVIGSLELAHPLSLSGGRRDARGQDWGAFQVAAFVDGASLRNRGGPQPAPGSIASVGVSLAWTPNPAFIAQVSYAKALIYAPVPGDRDLEDRGFEFSVTTHPVAWFDALRGR